MSGPTLMPDGAKLWLSLDEASALTGLSPSALWRLVERGVIGRVPHTARRLIPRAELERISQEARP